jgi:hypothetical protein
MADRTIPEDNPANMVTKKPGFLNPGAVTSIRQKARNAALKAKVIQGKNGTAHEQHMAHLEHLQHQKNQYNSNLKTKNPYNQ